MNWQTIAIFAGMFVVVAAFVGCYLNRAARRAKDAEAAAAVARAQSIDLRAKETLRQAIKDSEKLSDDQLLAEMRARAERARKEEDQ